MAKKDVSLSAPSTLRAGNVHAKHAQKAYSSAMEMTSFEKKLLEQEKQERHEAKKVYVQGVQGVDGGHC